MVSMVNAQAPDRDIPASDNIPNATLSGQDPSKNISGQDPAKTISGQDPTKNFSGAQPDKVFSGTDKEPTKPSTNSGIFTLSNPLKVNSIGELLHSLVQVFTYLVILFAVIMFVYLGFQYVAFAAQGNSGKIGDLHNKFIWLVAGVAIVIGARVIIEVIINTLSATGTVSPDVIQSAQNALKK